MDIKQKSYGYLNGNILYEYNTQYVDVNGLPEAATCCDRIYFQKLRKEIITRRFKSRPVSNGLMYRSYNEIGASFGRILYVTLQFLVVSYSHPIISCSKYYISTYHKSYHLNRLVLLTQILIRLVKVECIGLEWSLFLLIRFGYQRSSHFQARINVKLRCIDPQTETFRYPSQPMVFSRFALLVNFYGFECAFGIYTTWADVSSETPGTLCVRQLISVDQKFNV